MRKLIIVFIFSFLFLFVPHHSFAQEAIHNFDSSIIAEQDGSMRISEKIIYDFGEGERHGIFRYIPLTSRVGELYRIIDIDVTSVKRDGEDEPYAIDRSKEEIEIKIGDPDKTISGEHIYSIEYVVKNGIGSNYEDHDEIYWNATGNGWDVPIASASVTIRTDFGIKVGETICFTGVQGSSGSNCTVRENDNEKLVTTSTLLSPQEGLTFVASFPVNTFPKSTLQKNIPMDPDTKIFLIIVVSLLILLNFILAPLLLIWYFKKKHKKRFGAPVVTFDLPEDKERRRITPSEAGTIDTTKLDKDDITATLFDLAIRKYIRIEAVEKKGSTFGLGKKTEHKVVKLKDFDSLDEFENTLLGFLFKDGKEVMLSDVSLSYTEFQKLEKANFASLITRGFYTKNPATQMGALLGLGIASFFTLNIILGSVLLFLSRMVNGRTKLGDEMDWKIDGLKIFLKATNRYHTWQAKNILTLEKMIPYAMSLGYIDEFMKHLKIQKTKIQHSYDRNCLNPYTK